MSEWVKYARKGRTEMRKVTQDDIVFYNTFGYVSKNGENHISISDEDIENGSPKIGDMIARNSKNHNDKWLVAEEYFKNNFKEVKKST